MKGVASWEWVVAVALTLAVQFILWFIPHRGWDRHLWWDPHYLYLPTAVAALLLSFYAYLAPQARVIPLMVWFVGLLFMAGLGGLRDVVILSSLMAAGYLGSGLLAAAEGAPISLQLETAVAVVFLAICGYAGFVFQRLRRQREEMRALRSELARLALRDALTGLANRRHFEERLRQELRRFGRYGTPCSVALIDVDRFKVYNDALGHPAGDRILKELARVLVQSLRETDVVACYGGEEFAVILVETGPQEAWGVMERLRALVELHPFPREDVFPSVQLTVSIGVAGCGRERRSPRELVAAADRSLYAAKTAGRNQVALAERPPLSSGPP